MQIGQVNNASQDLAKQSPGSVLQWISQRTNWLMVYDGADGHYQTVEKYLPPRTGGNILITSRNVGLKRITLNSLQVLDMAEEEAVSLLLKSARLDGNFEHNSNFARKLAAELGGIPIALDQAGAYMLATQCGLANYLELYTNYKHELMSNSNFKGASDYDRTTYGTWDISMQNIETMAAKDVGAESLAAQSAIRILKIVAFLDHVNIPEELFKNAAENYMKRNAEDKPGSHLPLTVRLLDHQTLFLSKEGVWEKLQFLAGIRVLMSLSFIQTHGQLYSLHSLVQSWIRNRVPKEEKVNLYWKARALLSCSVILDYDLDNYVFCRLLAHHIRSNALHASELRLQSMYYEDECDRFILVFHCTADWEEVEKLLLVQADSRATKLGLDHPDTLTSMGNLASTYRNQGRWDEAEKLLVEVMNAFKAKLGSDHPDTLNSMANLASTYKNQGRWDEAEKLFMKVMDAFKAKLGSDHRDTLTSMGNLASTYRNQGRWNEAEKLEVEVMNAFKAMLGSDHLHTLTSMGNLASTYRNQGRWDEAEKLEVEVMNAFKAKLGSEHPDTLTSMGNLASTYRNQGRWDEAEKLEVEVMNAFKAKLGSEHPDTLSSMGNLASTYWNQGRWDEAEKLEVEVMNARKAKFGSDHPHTLTSMHNLASTYRNQGRWNEAEKLFVAVMNAFKAKLGSDHPDTLTSMGNLASTYRNQGRWDEAEKLEVEVMNAFKAKLGSDHPETLTSMTNLASTYWSQSRLNEAHSLLSHAVKTIQQLEVTGPHHPTVLHYIAQLDMILKEKDHKECQEMVPPVIIHYVMHVGFKLMLDPFFYLAFQSSGPVRYCAT